jgi:hypothetical protein
VEDLSHIVIPKIPVKEGLPALPQAVMDGFSDAGQIAMATQLMGFTEKEEVPDAGS